MTTTKHPSTPHRKTVLLALLPFWSPLIPPLGIACLKGFLHNRGFSVHAADANVEDGLREYYDHYFRALRDHVPREKQGNFYSIGQDVLRNHMMAHMYRTTETAYLQLIKTLVYKTFYVTINDQTAKLLNTIIEEFFTRFEQYLLRLMEKHKPEVLGLSVFSGNLPASMYCARLAKEKYPGIEVVMGGGAFSDQLAVGTPNLDHFLEKTGTDVDAVIIGEGEHLFLDYLEGRLPGDRKVHTLGDIGWKIMDLEDPVLPDFSDFHLSEYPNHASYTSRSCPFQCSFCSETVQWGKYRKKSPAVVVDELTRLSRLHGGDLFFMSDSLLNPVITGLAREFIENGPPLYWDGCIRVDRQSMDPEFTYLWRRGGFYRARLGLESGSPRLLKLMDKKITPEQIKESLVALADAGIKTSTLWVIGHPGETEEDFSQTLELIEEFKEYIYDVEGTPFWYHLSGQAGTGYWASIGESKLLYPPEAGEMLVARTWYLDCEPAREETYRRLNRFVRHLERLGIPNPYTLRDIYEADERWKKLHPNAVPPLVSIRSQNFPSGECRTIKKMKTATPALTHDDAWGF